MEDVSVRELRNNGGQILDRVAGGESMTITRNGTPVAVVSPLPSPRLSTAALLERWKNLPVIARDQLREGIAATALAHDLPLYTRNPRDFEGITNLDVRAV